MVSVPAGMVSIDNYDWQIGLSVLQCNKYMLENEIECDIYFSLYSNIDGEDQKAKVGAHKYMLISRSSVFRAMLCGPLAERAGQDNSIDITDIPVEAFRILLRYIYHEEGRMTEDVVLAVLYAATKYEIQGLQKCTLQFLHNHIKSDNVCVILSHAYIFDQKDLIKRCLSFIDENPMPILESSSFTELNFECVHAIVSRDSLQAQEDEVWKAVLKWVDFQLEQKDKEQNDVNRREILGKIVYEIRFPLIDPGLWQEKTILTEEEKENARLCTVWRRGPPSEMGWQGGSGGPGGSDRERDHMMWRTSSRHPMMMQRAMMMDMDMFDPMEMDYMMRYDDMDMDMEMMGDGPGRYPDRPYSRRSKGRSHKETDKEERDRMEPTPKRSGIPPSIFKTTNRKIIREIHRFRSTKYTTREADNDAVTIMCNQPIRFEGIGVYTKFPRWGEENVYIWTVEVDGRIVRNERTIMAPIPDSELKDNQGHDKKHISRLRLSESLELPALKEFSIYMCFKGNCTHRGNDGMEIVPNNDGVIFKFSRKALEDKMETDKDGVEQKVEQKNGTNSDEGQFPVVMYSKVYAEYRSPPSHLAYMAKGTRMMDEKDRGRFDVYDLMRMNMYRY